MAFFKPHHFDSLVSKEIAEKIAIRANEIIVQNGYHVYGTLYTDGTVDGFSSGQERLDKHTALLIDVDELGWADPDGKSVHMKTLENDDYKDLLKQRNNQLERELRNARNKGKDDE